MPSTTPSSPLRSRRWSAWPPARISRAQAAAEGLRKQAMATCRELIASHGLDMKLVGADIGFGGEKITFSFYSEERVDFRALVADLAKTLKMRIELRQVGAREEARMVGGLGPCGRDLCCTLFPGDDEPVSIRMAKEQNLPLNPMKISGLCGRLMCCLKYEQEQYVRFRKEAPPKGTPVSTPAGEGVIVGYNVTKDAITVRFEDGSYTEIRLSGCQCQEGGGLLVIPGGRGAGADPRRWTVSAGIGGAGDGRMHARRPWRSWRPRSSLGENGEPVEVIVAESSRRPRSRRGRGRRGRQEPGAGPGVRRSRRAAALGRIGRRADGRASGAGSSDARRASGGLGIRRARGGGTEQTRRGRRRPLATAAQAAAPGRRRRRRAAARRRWRAAPAAGVTGGGSSAVAGSAELSAARGSLSASP